jgi:hypothetical protein
MSQIGSPQSQSPVNQYMPQFLLGDLATSTQNLQVILQLYKSFL